MLSKLQFTSLTRDCRKMPRIDTPVKSQIWAAMFVELSWFGLFSFIYFHWRACQAQCLFYFSGGHSIWVNVKCYFTSRKETRGKKKNLICMSCAVWSQPDMSMDSIAPLIFLLIFSSVTFSRAQRKDATKYMFPMLLCFYLESTKIWIKQLWKLLICTTVCDECVCHKLTKVETNGWNEKFHHLSSGLVFYRSVTLQGLWVQSFDLSSHSHHWWLLPTGDH